MFWFPYSIWIVFAASKLVASEMVNSTYFNPMLPGWHSDPSCIFVPEEDNTFFCATSTFLVTPGIPIFASKDLVHWKIASYALTRRSQIPYINASSDQNDGIFAPTIRYHKGVFYVITVYVFRRDGGGVRGLIFNTTNPYENNWSEPVKYEANAIDPDLFWHENGKVYLTQTDITQTTIDLTTGELGSEAYRIWNGTGGTYPEGPHIYYKDNYYYLLIGEGGTELNHSATIARSRNIEGPYESYEKNPILTAKGTKNYFQTVGHADLFQDANGNWWAAALSTRSGPEWTNYPMGREAILTPVTWKTNDWPKIDMVYGRQNSWPLPPRNTQVPGIGPFLGKPDRVDFRPGESLPANFQYWRWPVDGNYEVSPRGHPNSLRLRSSRTISSTEEDPLAGAEGISLLLRLQTDTLFTYSVDVDFRPVKPQAEQEVGVTIFLTQQQHLDLGVVMLSKETDNESHGDAGGRVLPHLRLRSTGRGQLKGPIPEEKLVPIPPSWLKNPVMLEIQAKNDTHYTFLAASKHQREKRIEVGSLPAQIVSGDTGPFTGSLVGVYATTNNREGDFDSYISRWRYTGNGQKIDHDEYVPSLG